MAEAKPIKLEDLGGGAGRLAEFAPGDTLPKAALPELSAADVGAATAAQGELADTAVQPDDIADVVRDNDARLTDSRAPSGGAGGVLSGSYPNPGFAVDMATQAELEAGLAGKVDKVAGKGLSTEDYTTTEKSKLAGIAAGAQVNTVTSVAGKTGAVTLDKGDVGLGNVDNTSDVDKPVSTAQQTALNAKQPTLVSGANIKTVNGNSLLGSGDLEITGGGDGAPLFSVQWWPQRSAIPAGFVAADGQELSRVTYPDAWAGIQAGNVPTVADATWNSTPTERGKFTVGDGSTTFRLPDYNGKLAGSLGAVFLRGDGALSAGTAGVIQQDAFQDHDHAEGMGGTFLTQASAGGTVRAGIATSNNTTFTGPTQATLGVVPPISGSGTPRTASETRPLNVTGCWVIKLFGAVVNVGSADAAQLASDYANLASQVTALQSSKLGVTDKRVCTAWVNFNGTGTVAIRDSYNVSSITDHAVGDYTINFATPMANVNYAESLSAGNSSANVYFAYPTGKTTVNGLRMRTADIRPVLVDLEWVSAIFFGGK